MYLIYLCMFSRLLIFMANGYICKWPQMIISDFNDAGITEAVNDEAKTILDTMENPFRDI